MFQVFNEFNARSITDEWRVFTGLHKNPIFMGVIVITIALQIFIVEVGGLFTKTSGLTAVQWLVTSAIGLGVIPLGILMRFLPAVEDPSNFATVVKN
jgi:P-type Ca2+ transporter type 2C